MKFKPSDELGGWLSVIVVGIWIVNGVLITYILMSIDSIINGQLYGFGLQFSPSWAEPYWMSLNLTYVFLGLPLVLSLIVFGFVLVRANKHKFNHRIRRRKEPLEIFVGPPEAKVECHAQQESLVEQQMNIMKEEAIVDSESPKATSLQVSEEKSEGKEDNALVISCPNCCKVFNRPLIILDFSNGKTRLVNICPFCNHRLEETPEEKNNENNEDAGT
jgi:hypothetical protein